jgi:hypothetical protein
LVGFTKMGQTFGGNRIVRISIGDGGFLVHSLTTDISAVLCIIAWLIMCCKRALELTLRSFLGHDLILLLRLETRGMLW